jgi:hypothetical protein
MVGRASSRLRGDEAATAAQARAASFQDDPGAGGRVPAAQAIRSLVNFNNVTVPQRLRLVHLLSVEPAVPPEPRMLHHLRQVPMNESCQIYHG